MPAFILLEVVLFAKPGVRKHLAIAISLLILFRELVKFDEQISSEKEPLYVSHYFNEVFVVHNVHTGHDTAKLVKLLG